MHARIQIYWCRSSIFRHLKLKLLTQFPASNDEKYINVVYIWRKFVPFYGYVHWRMTTEISVMYGSEKVNPPPWKVVYGARYICITANSKPLSSFEYCTSITKMTLYKHKLLWQNEARQLNVGPPSGTVSPKNWVSSSPIPACYEPLMKRASYVGHSTVFSI